MSNNECPICMENIDEILNKVVTECGHAFHCSCLMKNAAFNGFGCPYCRTVMAEERKTYNDDDTNSYYSDVTQEMFNDDSLTAFRIFHQIIDNEEIEEEVEGEGEGNDWGTVDGDDASSLTEIQQVPDYTYVTQKLLERGITIEDLVKNILFDQIRESEDQYPEYERRAGQVYGQFRAIMAQFRPEQQNAPIIPAQEAVNPYIQPISNNLIQISLPEIAESKTCFYSRPRECICHN